MKKYITTALALVTLSLHSYELSERDQAIQAFHSLYQYIQQLPDVEKNKSSEDLEKLWDQTLTLDDSGLLLQAKFTFDSSEMECTKFNLDYVREHLCVYKNFDSNPHQ